MLKIPVLLILLSGTLVAQNLVPNPGFENAWTCPESFTKELVKKILPGWIVPNRATPDYFNRCNKEDVGIPENFAGSLEPKEGNAYIGLILKESFNPKDVKYEPDKDEYSREYITAKLLKPMKRTKLYCVSFYWSLAKYSDYAVDAIGVYFSREKFNIKNDGIITAKQQIFKKGKLLKTKNKWEEFCGVITPHGGEKFITIGNFTATKDIQYVKVDSAGNNFMSKYAYYLVDNVRVFMVDNEFECGCNGGATEVLKDYMVQVTDHGEKNISGNAKNDIETNNSKTKSSRNTLDSDKNNISENPAVQGMDNLKEVQAGVSVTLNNIFFALEESSLAEGSFTELDKLVQFLTDHPEINIEISGHSDNTGTDAFNQKLSKARAKAVADYLKSKKIKKKRLSWKGYGNTIPVADNNTEEGRAKNRRVEFTIVK